MGQERDLKPPPLFQSRADLEQMRDEVNLRAQADHVEEYLRPALKASRQVINDAIDGLEELRAASELGPNVQIALEDALLTVKDLDFTELWRAQNPAADSVAVEAAAGVGTQISRLGTGPDADAVDEVRDSLLLIRLVIDAALESGTPLARDWVLRILDAVCRIADAVLFGFLAAIGTAALVTPELLSKLVPTFVGLVVSAATDELHVSIRFTWRCAAGPVRLRQANDHLIHVVGDLAQCVGRIPDIGPDVGRVIRLASCMAAVTVPAIGQARRLALRMPKWREEKDYRRVLDEIQNVCRDLRGPASDWSAQQTLEALTAGAHRLTGLGSTIPASTWPATPKLPPSRPPRPDDAEGHTPIPSKHPPGPTPTDAPSPQLPAPPKPHVPTQHPRGKTGSGVAGPSQSTQRRHSR